MLSIRDAEALSKNLAAAGLEPSKTVPIFLGIKITCLLVVPALVYAGAVFLGYPTGKQFLYAGLSLIVGVMLPNWIVALIRGPYQKALRRGIPDALDLMVVCAEAGLGLESTVNRVAEEMKQSNRAVGLEFSLLTYEMRIMPDRRIALANLGERSGQPALKRLAGTIAQTLKYGTPLGQALRTLSRRDAQRTHHPVRGKSQQASSTTRIADDTVHLALSLHHSDGTACQPADGRIRQYEMTAVRYGSLRTSGDDDVKAWDVRAWVTFKRSSSDS